VPRLDRDDHEEHPAGPWAAEEEAGRSDLAVGLAPPVALARGVRGWSVAALATQPASQGALGGPDAHSASRPLRTAEADDLAHGLLCREGDNQARAMRIAVAVLRLGAGRGGRRGAVRGAAELGAHLRWRHVELDARQADPERMTAPAPAGSARISMQVSDMASTVGLRRRPPVKRVGRS
jgi:hypothetical protein